MSPGTSRPDIRCRSCGAALPADSTFCVFCGAAVALQALGIHCSGCGQPLNPGVRFCPGCGTPAEGPLVQLEANSSAAETPSEPPEQVQAIEPEEPEPPPAARDEAYVEAPAAGPDESDLDLNTDEPPPLIASAALPIYVERTHEPGAIGTPPVTARRSWTALVVISLTASTLAGAAAGFFLSTKRTILRRVAAGALVEPEGSSAYDLFLVKQPSGEDLAEIVAAATPPLERRGNEILTRLRQDNVDAEADWAEAARIYAWLNQMHPNPGNQSRQYFSQGRLRFLKGDNAAALSDFQRSIQLDGTWALPWNGLARVFLRMEDRLGAQQNYRRATEIDPSWIFPWINLGTISYELKDYVISERALRRALSLDPARASAHYYLAKDMDDLKRYCEAVSEYSAAVENARQTSRPGFSVDAARNRRDRLAARYSCR